ncbi:MULTISPECIES: YqaJ viral recombinase family protein [unclassified Pseudoclavibacter]|uniref:YqaJ viral recombinase family protein n=1 Tax=unclassified Pseudoclavibacter TaxID=2615177 RepID=UPI001E2850F6|nr:MULTISPECIES: YqaJ viral recombinase family protein [unclassified Pseudoclavibacter]
MVMFRPSHDVDETSWFGEPKTEPKTAPKSRRRDRELYGPAALVDYAAPPAPIRQEQPRTSGGLTELPAEPLPRFYTSETRPASAAAPLSASEVGVWRAHVPASAETAAIELPATREVEAMSAHLLRVLADSNDRAAWLKARSDGVTATDAARLATPSSVKQVVKDKVMGTSFNGNAYTDFGRQREPEIARWVMERHGIPASGLLFHAEASKSHLATPDGLHCDEEGRILLAEIKTTNKVWKRIPRSYMRQIWWQQYVLGAERTLMVWERHQDFIVVDREPKFVWIDRDEAEIAKLVTLANEVLKDVEKYRGEFAQYSTGNAAPFQGYGNTHSSSDYTQSFYDAETYA